MSYFHVSDIKIEGIATAVPKNKINYTDFYDQFGKEYMDKFVKSSGIKSLYKTKEWQTASDLGYAAAHYLFEKLGFDSKNLGLLVFATQAPDYKKPGNSSILHYRMGLPKECACVDMYAGCSGFVYGLQTIGAMMQSMDMEYALLIVSDTASKQMCENDRSTVVLIGDAGAAILLKKEKSSEPRVTLLEADGSGYRTLIIPAGGARYPDASHDVFHYADGVERTLYHSHMDGMKVFTFAIQEVPRAIKDYFAYTKTRCEDYDALCLHQANLFIMNRVADQIKFGRDKLLISIDRYGNTSTASIPLTLCDYYGDKQGEFRILASGFGIGLAWGVTSLQVSAENIFPIIETDDYFKEGKIQLGEL